MMWLTSHHLQVASLGNRVGTINRWNPKTGRTEDSMPIYSRKEIYVGRDPRRCQYVVDDPFISNKHLWIYTVIFDQDNPKEVAPLVYTQDISMNGTMWNGYRMGNGRSSYLLSDGDILQLSDNVYLKYYSEDLSQARCFTEKQSAEMKAFANDYIVTRRKLGSGAYGQVYMAFKKSTGQQFACKIVDLLAVKKKLAKREEAQPGGMRDELLGMQFRDKLELYLREATILQRLQHPNIIGLEKVIRSESTIYMFQDLITAGDLFSYIQYKRGKLPDIEAAVIVRQIVIALDFLHDQNIVHRDLKPDNILMTSRADGCRVVLTDFGCATLVESGSQRMSTMVGTFEFSAPEVVKRSKEGYTKAADLWSLGALTAVLLTGESPFDDMRWGSLTEDERLLGITNLKAKLASHNVGERAQNFVFRLLQHDASQRMDVKQALGHPWFTNPSHKTDFEALYKRSIRDWTPRPASSPRIVALDLYDGPYGSQPSQDSPDVVIGSENEPPIKTETPSQLSLSSIPVANDTDEEEIPRLPSSSLSDPLLPLHGAVGTGTGTSQPSQGSEDSTCPPSSTIYPRETACGIKSSQSPATTEYKTQHAYPCYQPVTTPPSTSDPELMELDGVCLLGPGNDVIPSKRPHNSDGEIDGEVYEVVRNPVTGKRQQVAYGACLE
ncbi:FHA domain-containing serine/threonine-protein kinase [Aspergillus lucknowensis]|uniref:Kinase-like domain-containing protein n=1 Tax=Aspergillus lucknowensis TaxID=176173 RepID=A0ABR4LG08_9EURO